MSETEPKREPDQLEGVPLPEHQPLLVGHDAAHRAVLDRLHGGSLPSAIMLHGPQGIGKATLAFRLAREILIATGDEDAHRIEEQISAGSHPNLFVLRRQPRDTKGFYTVIRVDDIRALRQDLRTTRGRAGHRVAIIDSIDDCNLNAANALLKTLEEPPADTIFFLISHRPGSLLPTIRSRCHNLALRPLQDAEVANVLSATLPTTPSRELSQAVGLAHGRPRKGFEALLIGDTSSLAGLQNWLAAPTNFPSGAHLALADALAADAAGSEAAFGRDMLIDWLAAEARQAALQGPSGRMRLASANELWDKAQTLFAETDSLNLDLRQTLVVIFDSIRRHVFDTQSAPISGSE
ncbi:MAG TPA: AAA family ATPase [Devosiaceae bacterium]